MLFAVPLLLLLDSSNFKFKLVLLVLLHSDRILVGDVVVRGDIAVVVPDSYSKRAYLNNLFVDVTLNISAKILPDDSVLRRRHGNFRSGRCLLSILVAVLYVSVFILTGVEVVTVGVTAAAAIIAVCAASIVFAATVVAFSPIVVVVVRAVFVSIGKEITSILRDFSSLFNVAVILNDRMKFELPEADGCFSFGCCCCCCCFFANGVVRYVAILSCALFSLGIAAISTSDTILLSPKQHSY